VVSSWTRSVWDSQSCGLRFSCRLSTLRFAPLLLYAVARTRTTALHCWMHALRASRTRTPAVYCRAARTACAPAPRMRRARAVFARALCAAFPPAPRRSCCSHAIRYAASCKRLRDISRQASRTTTSTIVDATAQTLATGARALVATLAAPLSPHASHHFSSTNIISSSLAALSNSINIHRGN